MPQISTSKWWVWDLNPGFWLQSPYPEWSELLSRAPKYLGKCGCYYYYCFYPVLSLSYIDTDTGSREVKRLATDVSEQQTRDRPACLTPKPEPEPLPLPGSPLPESIWDTGCAVRRPHFKSWHHHWPSGFLAGRKCLKGPCCHDEL